MILSGFMEERTSASALEEDPDTLMLVPAKGVARRETSGSPETGSQSAGRDSGGAASAIDVEAQDRSRAVGRDAPDIPNVVEYHLKVKSQWVARDQDQAIDSIATTTDSNMVAGSKEIKKEQPLKTLSENQHKELTSGLSKLSVDSNVFERSNNLPQVFQVKYLGSHDARGLWGIKHTRKPVDNMVTSAKSLPTGTILPFIKLVISEDGVGLLPLGKRRGVTDSITMIYPIETISYGVQDLVYTRVFSMIVVRETEDFRKISPFECHGFVCESKLHARQMTYALAAAFQLYSQHARQRTDNSAKCWTKSFAIEISNPNEIEADYTLNPED